LRAAVSAEALRWSRRDGEAVAQAVTTAMVGRYDREELSLRDVTAGARGPARLGPHGLRLRLVANVRGRGAWRAPFGAADPADSLTAVRRAAQSFRFAAPAVGLRIGEAGPAVTLPQPASLTADSGGVVTIAARGAGWRVASAGGGLPQGVAEVDRLTFASGAAAAHGRVRVHLSIGPAQDGAYDAAGLLRLGGGGARFTAERCARFDIARLVLGEQDVRRLSGRLCPAGPPLLALGEGWRISGRVEDGGAEVGFLQARLADAQGVVDMAGAGDALSARIGLRSGVASDLAARPRFNPVGLSGEAGLMGGAWRGALAVSDPAGRPLARLNLAHAMATGRGGVEIATGKLSFAPGGLQPAALSPLAAAIGSPAEGEAGFAGRFDWSPSGATSSGVLDVPRLDFQSPAGRVSGLTGRIVFTNLTPLTAAPGQALRASEVVTPAGTLSGANLTFGLGESLLSVAGGEAAYGGGRVFVEALALPLTPGQPIRGVLRLEGVDLDAKVSGRIAFEAQGTKVRITGGDLHAIEPGRLSIQRIALTGVAAEGEVAAPGAPAGEAPAPGADTFTDFAYQAMENLAFSKLDASVTSRSDGRLAVLFHIVGRHDPPKHQEIRLSLGDLIGRRFLNRKLPLPSDTGVDLTLDTTLNLDDLMADYAEYRRLHGSAAVQP
jgi:hypothetical protein